MTDRREFLKTGVAASAAFLCAKTTFAAGDVKLEETTVAELRSAMSSGQTTARKIAESYLARIADLDKKLNSVIEINPDALAIADARDNDRKSARPVAFGPLHGIPVLLKDNIDTADKMKTTAGSLALVEAPTPRQDAFLVKQLRDAGAVILGKTNLSEWANFRSTKSSSGWSGRGGQPAARDPARAVRQRPVRLRADRDAG